MPRRPAARLRVVPKPSAPARPKAVFASEKFYDCAPELKPLFRKHWLELGRDRADIPLDPNYDAFAVGSANGGLHILTARFEGALVGYVFSIIGPHLHYKSTLHAKADMYWLAPEHRKGWTGINMIKAWEAEMRRLGAVRICIGENLIFKGKRVDPRTGKPRRMRTLFEALGFRPSDIEYRKVLS